MRRGKIERSTKETDVKVVLNLDGSGKTKIQTGNDFFNHLLDSFAFHGGFDLKVYAKSKTKPEDHHLIEDVGITFGETVLKFMKEKKGFVRYGTSYGIMDEALIRVAIDLSGRTYLDYNLLLKKRKIGNLDTEVIEEFFHGFSRGARATLHIDKIKGKNTHHIIEATFKGFALALKEALKIEGKKISSTKGII